MASIHKLTKNGQTIYPATTTDAVVHPDLAVSSSKLIEEVNVSKIFPTGGIDGTNKYTLETAIAMIPESLRSVGIKCSFLDEAGEKNTWEYKGGGFTYTSQWDLVGAQGLFKLEGQKNYLFASASKRNEYVKDSGYYDAVINAYIPMDDIVDGAKYYLTTLNKNTKEIALYYTTSGEVIGNVFVYRFKEDSSFGKYSVMKTTSNTYAWILMDWTKLTQDEVTGYREGMELNPQVFKDVNFDLLRQFVANNTNAIAQCGTELSDTNSKFNKLSASQHDMLDILGMTYHELKLNETLINTAISERGLTFTSSLEKSTVLKLSTGFSDECSIYLNFQAYNIANAYYAIKGMDGQNLAVNKPTDENMTISYTGKVAEVWVVVSSDDTSYLGYAIGHKVNIDITEPDLSSVLNTVIREENVTAGLVTGKRTNIETGAVQNSTMFSYYELNIPSAASRVRTKLTTYPGAGLCFYDDEGSYISGINANTAEGGGNSVDYNGLYYTIAIPDGATKMINSVMTSGDDSYWVAYSAGEVTFIYDNNLEERIHKDIKDLDAKIDKLAEDDYLSTFPQVSNFVPQKKTLNEQIKILFIGSSWLINTYWYLNKITQAAGINALIKTAFIAGGSFSQWIDAYNNSTPVSGYSSENGSDWIPSTNVILNTLFTEQDWDIVCFQQGAIVGRDWVNYENYWKDWLSIIRRNINSKAILCYNATWTTAINADGVYTPQKYGDLTPYSNDRDGQTLWQKDNNENIAKFTTLAGLQGFISPCGAAVYAARRNELLKDDNHDLADDGIHLNSGMPAYIPAATWYETFLAPIYGVSIDTIAWIPDEGTQKCAVSWDNYTAMTEQHRLVIGKIVKLAASDRLGFRSLL